MTPPAGALAETLPRHRPSPRRAPVRHPRRVSGPGRAPARPAARTAAPARTALPARTTRPARSGARVGSRGRRRGLALGAIDAYERVADSTLLDRLVRGRLWIGLLAFALIGIVAMQLMVLKLNAGIGATLEHEASLQRTNAQLSIESATGSGEGRIEPLAAATGMTFAQAGSVHFVTSSPAVDISRAVASLGAPIQAHESPVETTSTAPAEAVEHTEATEPSGATEPSSTGEAGKAAEPTEAAPSSEAHSPEASAAATGEPEPSASAAGGVAAGH